MDVGKERAIRGQKRSCLYERTFLPPVQASSGGCAVNLHPTRGIFLAVVVERLFRKPGQELEKALQAGNGCRGAVGSRGFLSFELGRRQASMLFEGYVKSSFGIKASF